MTLNTLIRKMINRSLVKPLIGLIPGSVSGSARTDLVDYIYRNQKAKILAAWPR